MSGELNSIYSNVSFALHLHAKAMARLQEQASTGSRVNRASDDPAAAYQISGFVSQKRSLSNYMDNVSEIIDRLELASTLIQEMISGLSQTRTQLTQVSSGTYTEESRQRAAEAVDDMLQHVVALANTKHVDQYMFGGSNSASAPYVVEYANGKITGVDYQGDSDTRDTEVAPGLRASAFYAGDSLFGSNDRSDPIFIGSTGAKAGTGTPSVTGDTWLTVIHDGSNYKLSIDDGASYVTVPAGGDPNQAVTDSRTGQVLYVDSTGITSTGVEMVRVPGTYDVFGTLITIRDILENERGLSKAQISELMNSSLDSLREVSNHLLQAEVSLGSRIGFLSSLKGNLQDMKYDAEDEVTRLQEADIAQVAIDLARREVLYQMSLSVTGKLMSRSLLDFIT